MAAPNVRKNLITIILGGGSCAHASWFFLSIFPWAMRTEQVATLSASTSVYMDTGNLNSGVLLLECSYLPFQPHRFTRVVLWDRYSQHLLSILLIISGKLMVLHDRHRANTFLFVYLFGCLSNRSFIHPSIYLFDYLPIHPFIYFLGGGRVSLCSTACLFFPSAVIKHMSSRPVQQYLYVYKFHSFNSLKQEYEDH